MNQQIDPSTLHWLRQPSMYMFDHGKLVLETEPYTSFHSLSFDSTNAFGMLLDPMTSFCFTARMDYLFRGSEDECGLLLKRNNTTWAKSGVECRADALDLACTVYSDGYGDRSCREIGSGIRWMYLRVLYWSGNARFQYSFNGTKYSDMRWLRFAPGEEPVIAGIYACSGGDSYFDCTFSELQLREL
jgi:regulation of enolase protein 1 (concanavalin A-like superfamily)